MDRNEAIKVIKHNWPEGRHQLSEALKTLIPELNMSDDERIVQAISYAITSSKHEDGTILNEVTEDEALSWLEKVTEEVQRMIQWKGDNLKEVVEFTGKSPKFGEWFKTWEEYESYVHSHGDIFKLFDEAGNHYEVPVGAWIVKTPDGYNVPSKAKYKHNVEKKPALGENTKRMFIKALERVEEQNSKGYKLTDYDKNSWWEDFKACCGYTEMQKPAWSEEDKGILLDVKCIIDEVWHNQHVREEINYSYEELESLWCWLDNIWQRVEYPQSTWKPSDEQMEVLVWCKPLFADPKSKGILESLINDLKKLK